LPRVVRIPRRGEALHPTALAEGDDVLGLNLLRGCVHRCAFCSVRGHESFPDDGIVYLFANTADYLEEELAQRRPRAVYVSPATDPFPPIDAIQQEAARVVQVLARHNVEAWLMTRGRINTASLDLLEAHRERVKVTVALTTLDTELQERIEPGTASPEERLAQIIELKRRGIEVQVALDPLLPGLTDTTANLEPLLQALADAGVDRVRASYLFLRAGIAENLRSQLAANGEGDVVVEAFRGGPVLEAPGLAKARYLPKGRRQRGYATLMALAAPFSIHVSVCGLTNPDFVKPARTDAASRPSLRSLFLQAGSVARPE
jgi:DNA repair photolyase